MRSNTPTLGVFQIAVSFFLVCAALGTGTGSALAVDLSPQNKNAPEQPNAPIDSTQRESLIDSIKSKIADDELLSVEAKRIDVRMNQEGKVEMRGSVASSEERAKVENLAARVVGSGKILNMLQIENISQGIDGQKP